MKILTIGQNNFSIPSMDGCEIDFYIPTHDIKETIAYVLKSNAEVVIIQAEQPAPESDLYGGLELLIWLRIKGVNTHIVLVSFFSLETLMKNTKNAFILGAEGTTFCQMPFLPYSAELAELSKNLSKDDNLKTYLSSIFDIVHFRHVYANVWGLKRLVEVHKNYDSMFDESLIKTSQIETSLNYQIAVFIFGVSSTQSLIDNSIDGYINGFTKRNGERVKGEIQKVKELAITRFDNLKQSNIPINKILLIDDKADTGWSALLKSILPTSITIEILEITDNETEITLVNKFSTKYKDDEYLMVILDLRLLKSEENEHNYENLLSVKLMQQMLSKKNYNKTEFYYPFLKFVLFTASNQLHNMLAVLSKNEFTPHRIFIKEGFDINQTKDQLYKNYLSLLTCINQTATASRRGKPKKLESYVLEENAKIENFQNRMKDNSWQQELNQLYINHLKEYTHIVLDTNIFYLDKPLTPLSPDANIILCYPVFKEMERQKIERDATYNKFCAAYFVELYEDKVDKVSLAHKLSEIDTKFHSKESDIADNYFVEVVDYYAKMVDSNVLFISNDMKGKAGNFKNEAPHKAVLNHIISKNIKNVSVATIFNCNLKIHENSASPKSKVPKPVQNIIQPNSSNKPLAKNTNSGKLNQRPKVKWSECLLQSNGYEMKATLENKELVIRIGKEHRMGFKSYFEKLRFTSDEIVLLHNANESVYNIFKITDWINRARKL